jgi:hypothetical protein
VQIYPSLDAQNGLFSYTVIFYVHLLSGKLGRDKLRIILSSYILFQLCAGDGNVSAVPHGEAT